MTCSLLLWCDVEVMFHWYFVIRNILMRDAYAFSINLGACNSYMNDCILIFFIIILILTIHINCIDCVYVGEYYEYSLTIIKSLSWMLL